MKKVYFLALALVGLVAWDGTMSAQANETASDNNKNHKAKSTTPKPQPISCDDVVTNIASFNPGAGASAKKLWHKMCAEMDIAEKRCVVAAKNMPSMKACINKDKKLSK